MVEPQPSKLMARVRVPLPAPEKIEVNGTLLTREVDKRSAHIAQSVEHFLGKEEVIGSIPIVSTIYWQLMATPGRASNAKKLGN